MDLIKPFEEKYADYLKDESGFTGFAEGISFPSNEAELRTVLGALSEQKIPFTVQGSKTGIAGACVPSCGYILNLSQMNKITGINMRGNTFFLEVQPGISLCDINQALYSKAYLTQGWTEESLAAYTQLRKAKRQFFPPNPTESTATIGGMFSVNAAGPNALYYGKTSDYVEALSFALTNNELWHIQRGEYVFNELGCPLPNNRFLRLPHQPGHPSSPFATRADLDLIDFLAASEGMLGVIESLTLRLLPEPEKNWGVVCLFKSDQAAIDFSNALHKQQFEKVFLTTIEYFDQCTLELIMDLRATSSQLAGIPDIPPDIKACVYIELITDEAGDSPIESALLSLLELLADCGGDPDLTWAGASQEEIEKFGRFRHAAPEAVNMINSKRRLTKPCLQKTAADFSAPCEHFKNLCQMYHEDIQRSNIQGAVFGHVGRCHLHVNFLPVNIEEMQTAQSIIQDWAKKIIALGGWISEENGIGKLKKNLLNDVITEGAKQNIRSVKQFFDPHELLNPGNLL